MMSEPNYALYPGPVISASDGQLHEVSAHELARLYQVSMADCVVVHERDMSESWLRAHARRSAKLIPLRPRSDGDYRRPS